MEITKQKLRDMIKESIEEVMNEAKPTRPPPRPARKWGNPIPRKQHPPPPSHVIWRAFDEIKDLKARVEELERYITEMNESKK